MDRIQGAVLHKPFSLAEGKSLAQAFWIMTFALLTGIGAQIQIPHQPVPYTFQTFVVLLAGATLGPRNGFLSMMAYIALGMIGLPLFSGGGFGLARILGPTGGYLIAFPIAAFVIGYLLTKREGYIWTLVSMFIGLLIIFTLGTIQLNLVLIKDWSNAFGAGFLIFSWWDVLKLFAATTIYHQMAKRIRR
ncbi:MAG: biotin transporter BioY [Ignavibacteriae bacterium]|nr:biotin transporter BioY [Ignavibacteriota bacterium]